MEKFIQRFSHEHPLSLLEVDEDEDTQPYRCNLCWLPILSSPSYTCSSINCNFFLHKPCAQFPEELYHKGHHDTLYLEQPNSSGESCMRYKCKNYSKCKFDLHPLVAKPVEIKSLHVSHKHPLVAICQEISCLCSCCEEEHKGFFFYCGECNFWIHQDCTILPSLVKLPSHHPHPYLLSYSLPFNIVSSDSGRCSFCGRSWHLSHSGVYLCCECYTVAHVTCAKSRAGFLKIETRAEFIQLPKDEDDTFPSMVVHKFGPLSENHDASGKHRHPLILEDGGSSSRSTEASRNLVCDVCIRLIDVSSPFYRCNTCHFVAHHLCINQLPPNVEVLYLDKVVLCNAEQNATVFRNSVFPCLTCWRPSNGFSYGVLDDEGVLIVPFDVECAAAPKTIKHASHKQHVLFQTIRPQQLEENASALSCCSSESFGVDVYRCISCDFYIHIKCALLPRRTRHKFDEHPLELIMTYHNEDDGRFCEFCEGDIDCKHWYYGCGECEQYFHIDCIPSVGPMSKVKFGNTIVDKDVHAQHPLALTRMLTHGRHERCGVCDGIIEASADDEMAFHCSECYFWTHFSCARQSASGRKLYPQFLKLCQIGLTKAKEEVGLGNIFYDRNR